MGAARHHRPRPHPRRLVAGAVQRRDRHRPFRAARRRPRHAQGQRSADAPDGAATFRALCERAGQPSPTPTGPGPRAADSTCTSPPRTACGCPTPPEPSAQLVDTRAWGGYVVAAGSTTPAGRVRGPVRPRGGPAARLAAEHPDYPPPSASTGRPQCAVAGQSRRTRTPRSQPRRRTSPRRQEARATRRCSGPHALWDGSSRGATSPGTWSSRLFRRQARRPDSPRPSAAPPSAAP